MDRRADQIVKARHPLSKKLLNRLFEDGGVTYRGGRCDKRTLISDESLLEVDPALLAILLASRLTRESIPAFPLPEVSIQFEDEEVIALHKPAGLPSLPHSAGETRSLLSALLALRPKLRMIGPNQAPALLQRLDTETEGVVLAAKTESAFSFLRAEWSRHNVFKEYAALTRTVPIQTGTLLGRLIPRHRGSVKLNVEFTSEAPLDPMAFAQSIERVDTRNAIHWIRVSTATGVRHQVRATLAALKAPLIGDPVYAGESPPLGLLAHRVTFTHPQTGQRCTVQARLSSDEFLTLFAQQRV